MRKVTEIFLTIASSPMRDVLGIDDALSELWNMMEISLKSVNPTSYIGTLLEHPKIFRSLKTYGDGIEICKNLEQHAHPCIRLEHRDELLSVLRRDFFQNPRVSSLQRENIAEALGVALSELMSEDKYTERNGGKLSLDKPLVEQFARER